jgi:hypothetical protein
LSSQLGEPFDGKDGFGEPPFTGLGTRGDRLHDAVAQVLVDEAERDLLQAALTDAIWVRMSMR